MRISIVVLACTALLGCQETVDFDRVASSRVEVDLRELRTQNVRGQQVDCLSVLDEVALRANGREVGRTFFPPFEFSVFFEEVTVDVGEVTFRADVWSSSGILIYRGTTTRQIEEDGFEVAVPLQPQDAVLVVCPSSLVLESANDFFDSLFVLNLGSDTLTTRFWSPIDVQGAPFLDFDPQSAIVGPDSVLTVVVSSEFGRVGPLTMQIRSRLGDIDLEVETPPPIIIDARAQHP